MLQHMRNLASAILVALLALPAFGAETCDNKPITTDGTLPAGYYSTAEGLSGTHLKAALAIISAKGQVSCTYKEVWDAISYTDEDHSNPSNVILFYTGRSTPKDNRYKGGKGPDTWTREHVWAKSHGFKAPATNPAYTDIHHLRPADKTTNSDRSERDFDVGGNPHDEAPDTFWDSDSWEPRDEVKGDVARMLFYMDVRYEGADQDVPDLSLVDRMTDKGEPHLGKLCVLMDWHRADPVDDWERARHRKEVQVQGNRNPFIDRPEFAEKNWGASCGQ